MLSEAKKFTVTVNDKIALQLKLSAIENDTTIQKLFETIMLDFFSNPNAAQDAWAAYTANKNELFKSLERSLLSTKESIENKYRRSFKAAINQ